MTTSRSETSSASSWSWVTNSGGHVHLVVQPAQPVPQLLAHLGVERAERLVQQQHPRLGRQRPGQRHPLPLAAGQLGGQPVGELLQVHQLEQLAHPCGGSRPWAAGGSPARRRRCGTP